MKNLLRNVFICFILVSLAGSGNVFAQRKVEKLGRGVVATNTGSGKAFISWRFLASDPVDITFNVYRSIGGATATKLNATPIASITNYSDITASTSSTNSYYVKPVIDGVEQAASKSFSMPGSATSKSYSTIQLDTTWLAPLGLIASDYMVQHIYVGDLDGDGEYDYVVKRLPIDSHNNIMLEAYMSDGTFKWRIDLGKNVEQGAPTHNPFVLVYDFDGDGKAEVLTRSGVGTKFADGYTIPANASGITDYRTFPAVSLGYMLNSDAVPEYISMVNGLTGVQITKTDNIPPGAKSTWTTYWGDNYGHRMAMSYAAVAYLDGVHPSIVTSRGPGDKMDVMALDFANNTFTTRWKWSSRNNTSIPTGYRWNDFHNLRVADVDGDGKDEICFGVNTMDDNGTPLYYAATDIGHGDRFVVADIDPDRPGLECYAIQQSSNILAVYYDAKDGSRIKTWSADTIRDVGRGDVGDLDPRYKGLEMYSYAHDGMFNAKGDSISSSFPHPALSIWWDGDLQRELLDAADGNGYNPVINKWDYATQSTTRLLSLYSQGGGYSTKTPYAGRAALYGDILGDWREEVFCENDKRSEIRIFSATSATTNRIYCLMQDPEYRLCIPLKGYLPSTEVDYYLGVGMATPPIPPIFDAKKVWKGGLSSNIWDTATKNWSANSVSSTFANNDSVMFDFTGLTNTSIQLSGALTPGQILVNSPNNYSFGGTGSLAGTMGLFKYGKSTLTLSTKNSYTGKTVVNEGTLYVNAKLSGSPVTVYSAAMIGGSDTIAQAITLKTESTVAPGTTSTVGTLTFGSGLTLVGQNTCLFDITNDATGLIKPSDKIVVTGNLVITGANNFVFNNLSGTVNDGKYPLIKYSGTFTGNLSLQNLTGITDQNCSLKDSINTIWLVVSTGNPNPVGSLMHQWNFDDGTANDAVTSAPANGTLTGGATIVNKALTTTVNGQYVSLPAATLAIKTYPAITMEAWCTSSGTTNPMLCYFGNTTAGKGAQGSFMSTSSRTAISCISTTAPNTTENNASGINCNDGALHQLVSVINSNSISFYVDGVFQSTTTLTTGNNIAALGTGVAYLAKSGYTADQTFLGSINKFSIYNKSLNTTEILYLYKQGAEASLSTSKASISLDNINTNTTFTVNGASLSSDISITAPTGITVSPTKISKDSATNVTVTVTYDGITSPLNGTITLTTGNVQKTIAVTALVALTPSYYINETFDGLTALPTGWTTTRSPYGNTTSTNPTITSNMLQYSSASAAANRGAGISIPTSGSDPIVYIDFDWQIGSPITNYKNAALLMFHDNKTPSAPKDILGLYFGPWGETDVLHCWNMFNPATDSAFINSMQTYPSFRKAGTSNATTTTLNAATALGNGGTAFALNMTYNVKATLNFNTHQIAKLKVTKLSDNTFVEKTNLPFIDNTASTVGEISFTATRSSYTGNGGNSGWTTQFDNLKIYKNVTNVTVNYIDQDGTVFKLRAVTSLAEGTTYNALTADYNTIDIAQYHYVYSSALMGTRGGNSSITVAVGATINLYFQRTALTTYNKNAGLNNLSVFPTITRGLISIAGEPASVEIVNLAGQVVKHVILNEGKTSVSLTDLSTGVYFVKLHSASGAVKVQKVIYLK